MGLYSFIIIYNMGKMYTIIINEYNPLWKTTIGGNKVLPERVPQDIRDKEELSQSWSIHDVLAFTICNTVLPMVKAKTCE